MSLTARAEDPSAAPEYILWPYKPSVAGGVIAAIVMFILFLIHLFRLFRNRTWFCIPFVIGALFEGIGYSARAASHYDTKNLTPYIIQSMLILLAPILFAASIYMILGRLMRRTDSTDYSLVRATWLTKVFVGGDILCFCIQGGGAGILTVAKTAASFKKGENIILGGLILQILIFGFFIAVAATWHRRLLARPTARSADVAWQKMIWLLYAASICVTIRNLLRVIEYGMGQKGYLLTHEWPIYVYDFLLMMITLVVCVAWYDPNIKPDGEVEYEFAPRRERGLRRGKGARARSREVHV